MLGFNVTVEATEKLRLRNGVVGEDNFDLLSISIQGSTPDLPHLRANIEHTYLHELLHWIFYCAARQDLVEDEQLTDILAGLLHKSLTTSKGELKINAI